MYHVATFTYMFLSLKKDSAFNSPKSESNKTHFFTRKSNRTIDETNAINASIQNKNGRDLAAPASDYSRSSASRRSNSSRSRSLSSGENEFSKEIDDEQLGSATSSFSKEDAEATNEKQPQLNDEDFTKPVFRPKTPHIQTGGMSGPSHRHLDEPDFQVHKRPSKKIIPDDIHISILEVFIYLWGVITFFADLISDIILSIEYFDNKRSWLGFMTLMFTIVPNVTLSLFSLSWYIDKYYTEKQLSQQTQTQNRLG